MSTGTFFLIYFLIGLGHTAVLYNHLRKAGALRTSSNSFVDYYQLALSIFIWPLDLIALSIYLIQR